MQSIWKPFIGSTGCLKVYMLNILGSICLWIWILEIPSSQYERISAYASVGLSIYYSYFIYFTLISVHFLPSCVPVAVPFSSSFNNFVCFWSGGKWKAGIEREVKERKQKKIFFFQGKVETESPLNSARNQQRKWNWLNDSQRDYC